MFDGAEFRRRADGKWMWQDQVIADDDEHLRPRVALMASLAGRVIATFEREGDVVRVTTKRKRPCRRPGGRR